MRVTWLKSQTVSQCTCERCFKTLEKVSPSFQLSVETRFPKKWAPRARLKNIDCLINNLSGRAGTLWLSQLSRWLKPACHQSVSEFDFFYFWQWRCQTGPEDVTHFTAEARWQKCYFYASIIYLSVTAAHAAEVAPVKGIWLFTSFFLKNHHSPSLFLFLLRICSQFPTCALINHLCWMGMHITALTAHADVW